MWGGERNGEVFGGTEYYDYFCFSSLSLNMLLIFILFHLLHCIESIFKCPFLLQIVISLKKMSVFYMSLMFSVTLSIS